MIAYLGNSELDTRSQVHPISAFEEACTIPLWIDSIRMVGAQLEGEGMSKCMRVLVEVA